jgi:membrane protein YqaA with SNARE-associated domain
MLDRLYSRILALAASRHTMGALILVAFAEASFFPLPPDLRCSSFTRRWAATRR